MDYTFRYTMELRKTIKTGAMTEKGLKELAEETIYLEEF